MAPRRTSRPANPLTTAILEQLRAEIGAHGATVKSVAAAIQVDYDTFRNYVNGEREMPVVVLTQVLEYLRLPYPTFAARAVERVPRDLGA